MVNCKRAEGKFENVSHLTKKRMRNLINLKAIPQRKRRENGPFDPCGKPAGPAMSRAADPAVITSVSDVVRHVFFFLFFRAVDE